MKTPTLKQLDEVRKEGFRPGIVACIVHESQILMFYKEEYGLWMLPQGGIKNKETTGAALERILLEEVGKEFVSNLDLEKAKYIDTDRMEFKPGKHKMDALQDDAGNPITMLGKDYYFCVVPALSKEIDITKTFYDEHFWMSFREAYFIAEKIYQKGKRRITIKILNALQSQGIIS